MAGTRNLVKKEVHVPMRELINIGAPQVASALIICPGCTAPVTLKNVAVGQTHNHHCGKILDLVWYRGVTDEKELEQWLADASGCPSTSFDYETTGLDVFVNKIVGVSFCRIDQPGIAIYVPMRHEIGQNMDPDRAISIFAPFLASHPMNAHNMPFEWMWSYVHGKVETKINSDTAIESWLDDPNRAGRFDSRSVGLKEMAEEFWDFSVIKLQDMIDLKTMNFGMVDTKRAIVYGCQDSDFSTRLSLKLTKKNQTEQANIWKLEHELIPELCRMKLRGISLNSRVLADGALIIDKEIEQLEQDVFRAMGFEVNPDPETGIWIRPFDLGSNAKVAEQLFLKMGIPYDQRNVGKPTKTFPQGQPSVGADALADLRDEYEVIDKILIHSETCTMRDNYITKLPTYVDPVSGFIHGNFNQAGAPTGRFSHSTPNLAQIPKKRD